MAPEALALLGLPADYDRAALSSAYRRLVRLVHPDRMVGASRQELDDASALLARVNEANEVLGRALRASSARRADAGPATAPQSAARPEPSTRPTQRPMSFEMFSKTYEESVWSSAREHPPRRSTPPRPPTTAPSPSPQAPSAGAWAAPVRPAAARDRKRFRPAVIAVVVVVVLLVGGFLGTSLISRGDASGASTRPPSASNSSVSGNAYSDSSYLADSVDSPSCTDDGSCWQWRISGIGSCDSVKVTVGFSTTSGPTNDYTRDYTVSGMASGDVRVLTVNSTDSETYAGIDDITCA